MFNSLLVTAVAALAGLATADNFTNTLKSAGLTTTLNVLKSAKQNSGKYTLGTFAGNTFLAPTNDAWTTFLATPYAQTLFASNGSVLNASVASNFLAYSVLGGVVHDAPQGRQFFFNTNYTSKAFNGTQKVKGYRAPGDKFTFYGADNRPSVSTTGNIGYEQSGSYSNIIGIDAVLVPPFMVNRTALDFGLTAFLGALNSANLTNTLANNKTPLTYFVPSNDAFSDVETALSGASMSDLVNTLKYHVVSGRYYTTPNSAYDGGNSFDHGSGPTYKTQMNNKTLTVSNSNGQYFVNNAKIVVPNVLVANGVVHVIDQVLNPASTTVKPAASMGVPAYADAVTQTTDVPFTSAVTAAVTTTITQAAYTAAAAPAIATAAAGLVAAAAGAAALLI